MRWHKRYGKPYLTAPTRRLLVTRFAKNATVRQPITPALGLRVDVMKVGCVLSDSVEAASVMVYVPRISALTLAT